MKKKSSKTYHSGKGMFTNDNFKKDQDEFYNASINDKRKMFSIEVLSDLTELFGEGED